MDCEMGGRDLKYSTIPWKNQTHIPILYKKECPYCYKIIAPCVYSRCHGEKCKYKI